VQATDNRAREAAVTAKLETPARIPEERRKRGGKGSFRRVFGKSYLLVVLLVIVAVGAMVSPNFLTVRNAGNVIAFSSIIALLAVGQFYVILTGGIDLSVGAVLAMSTVVAALLLRTEMNAVPACILTLAACGIVGLINGLLIVWLGITPFIATLAMMSMVQGFSYIIQSTSLIGIDNDLFITMFSDGRVFSVASPVLIFVVITIIAASAAVIQRSDGASTRSAAIARRHACPACRWLATSSSLMPCQACWPASRVCLRRPSSCKAAPSSDAATNSTPSRLWW